MKDYTLSKERVQLYLSDSIEDVCKDFMKIMKKKSISRLNERIDGFYTIEEAVKKFEK